MMRLNLRVSGAAEELLHEMAEQLDVSYKEIILDALGLYHLAVRDIENGNPVGSRDGETGEFKMYATPTLGRWASKFERAKEKGAYAAKKFSAA